VHVRAKNDNYSNVAEADVVFRITKRPIKVAAGILETEYDGSEKAVTEFTYTVSNKENTAGALKDHKVSAVLKNNTRTEAGEQTVSVEENSVRILSGEADVTKNYAVSLEDGKLTVKRKDGLKVTVDAESLSHVYDGAGHGIKAAEASDAKGTTIEYSTDGESWSGTIPQFTEYQEDGYPVYVRATNPNYSNTAMADVIFMITQRPAHIQASNDGKVFGTADPELMASVTGIVTGEKLNYNLNRVAGEDVGTYPIEVILGSNPNYSITYDNAVFEITSADTNKVFITGTTATYDGKAYGVDASVVQNGSTILYSTNQTDWSETAPTFTEAGTYTVYVKATNPNYNETQVAEGTVVISKREVTITADSAEKRYDGTDLTAPTATITGGTLVEGQTLESVTVTGAQRSTGTSANVASNAMIKSGNTDVTANYAITYTDGVLTVTSVGGNSGGNPGGNGGGSTPNENKPYQPGGPGDNNGPTVTIDPDAVPLANAPVDGSPTDNLILIDDGNVPLAGLPKTGDRAGAQAGLAAILSGFLLAAFSMLNNKKKEENK
ncbi:doubled motif LPXTG anchor domain-containing protein, partial [Hungatella sp.]